jgi:hypothetical protein
MLTACQLGHLKTGTGFLHHLLVRSFLDVSGHGILPGGGHVTARWRPFRIA